MFFNHLIQWWWFILTLALLSIVGVTSNLQNAHIEKPICALAHNSHLSRGTALWEW